MFTFRVAGVAGLEDAEVFRVVRQANPDATVDAGAAHRLALAGPDGLAYRVIVAWGQEVQALTAALAELGFAPAPNSGGAECEAVYRAEAGRFASSSASVLATMAVAARCMSFPFLA